MPAKTTFPANIAFKVMPGHPDPIPGQVLVYGLDDGGVVKGYARFDDGTIVPLGGEEVPDPLTLDEINAMVMMRAYGVLLLGTQIRLNSQAYVISPGAGPVDNYTPGFSSTCIFQNTDSGGTTITGIAFNFATDPSLFMLFNNGPGDLILTDQDLGSDPEARFALKGGLDRTLAVGEGVWVVRDGTAERWRLIG
jgi:hypothetical protein